MVGDALGDPSVAAAERRSRVDHEADDVDVADGVGGGVVEAFAEKRARLVDARRVDEDDLDVAPVEHPAHLRAGRLHLVGHDRDLGAEDPVEQRRFPDVGPPHEGGEARPHSSGRSSPGRRVMRTRPMRRPCTFSARSRWPSKSTVSPSVGT